MFGKGGCKIDYLTFQGIRNIPPSVVEVALSENDMASLEVKNKNILFLWELLGYNYKTFPC